MLQSQVFERNLQLREHILPLTEYEVQEVVIHARPLEILSDFLLAYMSDMAECLQCVQLFTDNYIAPPGTNPC